MSNDLTVRYAGIQAFFWMGFASISGFASVFLLDCGFSNTQIGLVIAISGLISAALQPMVATMAENSDRLSLKTLLNGIGLLVFAAGLGLIGLHRAGGPAALICLLYGGCLLLLQLALPLVNASGTEAINRGRRLNWGAARGVGSIAYAAAACALGFLTDAVGGGAVPALIALSFGLLVVSASRFPFGEKGEGAQRAQGGAGSPLAFFQKYPRFTVLLAGTTLIYMGHMILNNFTFQIIQSKGGGSAEMGVATALSAVAELPTMFLFGVMVKRVRCDIWVRLSGVFFTLKVLFSWLAPNVPLFYGVQVLQMLGWGLISVASVHYINAVMGEEDAIKGQAYYTVTLTLGTVLGALAGGNLLDLVGVNAMLAGVTGITLLGTLVVSVSAQRTQR